MLKLLNLLLSLLSRKSLLKKIFLNQNFKTKYLLKIKTTNQCSLTSYMVLVVKKKKEIYMNEINKCWE